VRFAADQRDVSNQATASFPFPWCLSARLMPSHLLRGLHIFVAVVLCACGVCPRTVRAQAAATVLPAPAGKTADEFTQQYNQKLALLAAEPNANASWTDDYRLGPEDLLEISVLEAPDLSRTVRISSGGQISLPLLDTVRAAGLTPRELEAALEALLRQTYMKDPHVSVFVKEMQSHSVSVFGAVQKPGVFQIRGAKPLVEVLSMAQGLAEDAGDTVIVVRGQDHPAPLVPPGPVAGSSGAAWTQLAATGAAADSAAAAGGMASGQSIELSLKDLLDSGDPRSNVLVYPGDVVKVTRAGIVYVVGEVKKPGGFLLKTNENVSVLQAIALAEGFTHTSTTKKVRIISTDANSGKKTETSVDVNRILAGKDPDLPLHSRDIVFVPNSAGKTALFKGTEDVVGLATGVIIYRR
jgi:polysaccharide biosynthesis/export protein